ncbi:MAG: methyltransferase [Acidimicrobiales bacterium]
MTSGAADKPISAVDGSIVAVESFAVGGRGVARLDDGRVAFVDGAVPGDMVLVSLLSQKRRYVEAEAVEIARPSPIRVEPWCPHRAEGCGGCDWQHVEAAARRRHQVGLIAEVLDRSVGASIEVEHAGSVPDRHYRTSARLSITGGRAGFKRSRSAEVVPFGSCGVLHDGLGWVAEVDWGGADEVMVRHSGADGVSLAVVHPSVEHIDAPDSVTIVGADEIRAGRRAWIYEQAAGQRFRLSAGAFFQSGPAAVELLVDTIAQRVGNELAASSRVADLYGGVGVFTKALASMAPRAEWLVVESNRSAVADARVNLSDVQARVIATKVERLRPARSSVVIADPPRSGLGAKGAKVVADMQPESVVLVSCDAGALARDARLLAQAGFQLLSADVLDLFPQTSHVEVVSVFGGR